MSGFVAGLSAASELSPTAARVFSLPMLVYLDDREDYGETAQQQMAVALRIYAEAHKAHPVTEAKSA